MNFEQNDNLHTFKDIILDKSNFDKINNKDISNSILINSINKLKLYKYFEEIVGEYIFNKCFLSFDNKKLKIITEHNVIKTELLLRKESILKQLNDHCGEHFVKNIDIY